ncbi:hypothetical protein [Streptomyces hokutonensis]|uniref:Uncharacterized protein n=1 Tax=Streptomyces hokutonensis TaxID=1306990 RepID=A0ABW6M7M0_9ACTN
MNDSTPPGDGEPTRFAKAKNWCRKHEPKLRAAGAVGLAVGLIVVGHVAERQDAETYDTGAHDAETDDAETNDAEDGAASEPVSATKTTGGSRQSPSPHVRNLHKGWNASPEKQAQYKAETGEDLPPGTTWVHLSEDEGPGEAAA